jgi:hypothetical protein
MPAPTSTREPSTSIQVVHFLIKPSAKSVYAENLVIRVLPQLTQRARLKRDIMQKADIIMLKAIDVSASIQTLAQADAP